jgi:hypothetical protein
MNDLSEEARTLRDGWWALEYVRGTPVYLIAENSRHSEGWIRRRIRYFVSYSWGLTHYDRFRQVFGEMNDGRALTASTIWRNSLAILGDIEAYYAELFNAYEQGHGIGEGRKVHEDN